MCGIFGIVGHPDAVRIVFLGLHGLQHRGQESAGIAVQSAQTIKVEKGMGLAAEVFTSKRLSRLSGETAIGHVRYSTAGASDIDNAQPLTAATAKGIVAVAHNGNLVNAPSLRRGLVAEGAILRGSTDTELILHLTAQSSHPRLEDAVLDALSQARGAYSLLFLHAGGIMAVRDPMGFRPLFVGSVDGRAAFASESAALDLAGASRVREIEPGEVILASADHLETIRWRMGGATRFCIFEFVYFARPDTVFRGISVAAARRRMGEALAREHPADAQIIVPVPDSGLFAALGYAGASGIPFEFGIIRNHYVGRTFIQPSAEMRASAVRLKLAPVRALIEGRNLVLVDDSIVRGTTMRQIVRLLRAAGARAVHVRIASPPVRFPCYYGIDTPVPSELIAHARSTTEIRDFIEADSLAYLSREGMINAIGGGDWFCASMFDGDYPDPPEDELRRPSTKSDTQADG